MCHPTINLDETKPGEFEIWFKYHVRTPANQQEQIAEIVRDSLVDAWRQNTCRVIHGFDFVVTCKSKDGFRECHAGVFIQPDGISVDVFPGIAECQYYLFLKRMAAGMDGTPEPHLDPARN